MKRFAIIFFILTVICSKSKAQARFVFKDSMCISSPVSITDSSKNALTYCFSFDSLNIKNTPTTVRLSNINYSMNYPLGGRLVEDGGNYYLFSLQYQTNNLVRWDLGTNPLNTVPLSTHVISNILPGNYNEDIEFIKENGIWYAIANGGAPGVAAIGILNFGALITNTAPTYTAISLPTLGTWPHQLNIFKQGINYIGFSCSRDNGNIQRLDFGNSITNIPTLTTVYTTNQPSTNFAVENENGNWFMLIMDNLLTPSSFTLLNFGSNVLNNTPTATAFNNPSNKINAARGIKLFKSCNQLYGIVNNQSNHAGSLGDVVLMNFTTGTIVGTATASLVGASGLGWDLFWNQVSNTFFANNAYHFFAFDGIDTSIVRVDIPLTGNTLPLSFTTNPSSVTYNSAGQHHAQLLTNFGNVNQSYYCDDIHSLSSIGTKKNNSICTGDSVALSINPAATAIVWNPTTLLSCNNCYNPKAHPLSSSTYIAVDSVNNCLSRDTFNIQVMDCKGLCKGTFNFNGNNEVQLPLADTNYYSSNGFTWECWFKGSWFTQTDSSYNKGNSLIMVEDAVPCEDINLGFGWSVVKHNHLGFSVDQLGGCTNRDNNPCTYKPSGGWQTNQWYHVAAVKSYSGNFTQLYINGQMVDNKLNTKTPMNRNNRTRIGTIITNWDSSFVGKIDEVRIWRYARTATEILNQYNTCLNGNEPDLVAYYKANEGKGLTAFDAAAFYGYNDGTASVNTIWDSTDNAPILPRNCVVGFSPIVQTNSPICSYDTFKINVLGLIPSSCKYEWKRGNSLISSQKNIRIINAIAGKYYLTITDTINKCNAIFYDSVQLIVLAATMSVNPTHSICKGDTIHLQATVNAGNINWNPITGLSCGNCSNPTAQPNSTTKYYITATNGSCTAKDSITVTVKPIPTIIANHDTTICNGNSVHIVASSIGTMTWSATNGFSCLSCAQATFNGNASANYFISSTLNGCVAKDTVRISVNATPTLSVVSPISVCIGDTIRLSANSNTSVTWNPSTGLSCSNCLRPLAQVLSHQVYHITAGVAGCSATDSVVVNVKPLPTLTVSNDTEVCYGNTIYLFASSSGVMSWYLSSGIVCNNCPQVGFMDSVNTTFYVTAVGANTCITHDSVVIKVDRKIPFPKLKDSTICVGAIVHIILSNAQQYTWRPLISNCNTCNNVFLSPTKNTTYAIIETNGKCIDSTHFKINLRKVFVNAGNDTLIAQNTTAQLHASGATNYSWQSNTTLSNTAIYNPVANPLNTTTYVVTGNDNFGCKATDTVIVFVSALCGSIVAPNAFSPNDDNKNDVFKLISQDFASIKYFRIYNRWGQQVFETTNINDGWDGKFNNTPQPVDVFVYYVQLDCPTLNNPIIKGNITLVR